MGRSIWPAMARLAEDPEVAAVLVLTDGYIEYPSTDPPYRVLWALLGKAMNEGFAPPYGEVVRLRMPSGT